MLAFFEYPLDAAQPGQRFRLVTLDRYRQRYRKFQAAVIRFEETVSESRPVLPLKDRRPEAFEDGFVEIPSSIPSGIFQHDPCKACGSCATHPKRGSFSTTKQTLSKRYSRRNQK
jgi:hypothetical protein